jgi:hypothetical protein
LTTNALLFFDFFSENFAHTVLVIFSAVDFGHCGSQSAEIRRLIQSPVFPYASVGRPLPHELQNPPSHPPNCSNPAYLVRLHDDEAPAENVVRHLG